MKCVHEREKTLYGVIMPFGHVKHHMPKCVGSYSPILGYAGEIDMIDTRCEYTSVMNVTSCCCGLVAFVGSGEEKKHASLLKRVKLCSSKRKNILKKTCV